MIAGGRHHEEISGGGSPRASVSERSGPSGAVDRPRLHHTEAKRERSGEGKRARLHPAAGVAQPTEVEGNLAYPTEVLLACLVENVEEST